MVNAEEYKEEFKRLKAQIVERASESFLGNDPSTMAVIYGELAKENMLLCIKNMRKVKAIDLQVPDDVVE